MPVSWHPRFFHYVALSLTPAWLLERGPGLLGHCRHC